MATTGAQILSNLKKQVNTAYTGQINTALFNYVSERAIVGIVDEAIKAIPLQSAYDTISKLIKTEQEFTPNNNQVLLKPLIITNVSIGANCTITFDREHNLAANTPIIVSGVEGTVASVVNVPISTYTILSTTRITTTLNTSSYTYTAGTGKAISSGYIIDDYYYLLTTNVTFKETLNYSIKSVFNSTKITKITISYANNIADKERINFTGFNGLSTIGNKYVKVQGQNVLVLYDDESLTIPTILTGSYTGGGTMYREYNSYTKPYVSDEKNTIYVPSVRYPRQESNSNRLKVYPLGAGNISQTKYKVDYVSLPVNIDSTNSVYDYEQVYNKEFLNMYYVRAASIFLETLKDFEMFQILNAGK